MREFGIGKQSIENEAEFCTNFVSTSKYTVASFIPIFLYEQFSKFANLFFLFISVMQLIPGVSSTSRFSTLIPLCFVLGLTAIKELLEDRKRRIADKAANESLCFIFRDGIFTQMKWQDIRVGDLIRVERDQQIPADICIVNSSLDDSVCFIETSNLDGETNLKLKSGNLGLNSDFRFEEFGATLKCEEPNSSLYTFEGTVQYEGITSLSADQIILRGSFLKNTEWIVGIVVFTGPETKLMQNASKTRIKKSDLELKTNTQIIFLLICLVCMSLTCVLGRILALRQEALHPYLQSDGHIRIFQDAIMPFLTYIVLFNNLIPISLIVTMEVVKYKLASYIEMDVTMYHEETDTPATAKTSNVIEELGQIEYIFTDKTGTLTCNQMLFKKCVVAGRCYSVDVSQIASPQCINDAGYEIGEYSLSDILDHVQSKSYSQDIDMLLIMLSVCHTVMIEEGDSIKYQSASPDEEALVKGAASIGYVFFERTTNSLTIKVCGKEAKFDILNILEFNSTRKRMSVIVRDPSGSILLLCKGADSVILERSNEASPHIEQTLNILNECAANGLRTLCFATRILSEEVYSVWNAKYVEATMAINNRSERLDKCFEEIEQDLYFLGATAIEDRLQDGVPETLQVLREAEIGIFVLTGDRKDTAINIGYSSHLLSRDMILYDMIGDSLEKIEEEIDQQSNLMREVDKHALVIDGRSLEFALKSDYFQQFCLKFNSVICCRVSPLQKALVVEMIKKTGAITLAIGDGANDVSMIQSAHIGVGISGNEGMQAARSADFAFAQFRFLKPLLLVHGAWAYQRMSKLILYSFYKNIILYLMQFWFVFYNMFTGQTLFESWILTIYNTSFTFLPPFVLGIFDQHLNRENLLAFPRLYQLGRLRETFNSRVFFQTLANSIFHSLVIFLVVKVTAGSELLVNDHSAGHWFYGMIVYSVVIVTVLLKSAILTNNWTIYSFAFIFGSFVMYFAYVPLYTWIAPLLGLAKELHKVGPNLYSSLIFWLLVFGLPCLCLSRDILFQYYRRSMKPKLINVIHGLQVRDRSIETVQTKKSNLSSVSYRGFSFSQTAGQFYAVQKLARKDR